MFKDQLASGGRMLVFAGAWDALSAKIIEAAGFDGVWLGSMTTTSSFNATLDLGLRTPREQVELVHLLKGVTKLPILVDGEGGWGSALQAAYWTREFERAGAEGIMYEDQTNPVATIYVRGSVYRTEPLEDSVAKFKAAAEARADPSSFKIIARSSAMYAEGGRDAQIRRLKAYQKAGADIVWASSYDAEELKMYRKQFEGPIWTTVNLTRPNQARMSVKEFEDCGVQILCFEAPLFLVAFTAALEAAKDLRQKGSIASIADRMMNFDKFLEFMGYADVPAFMKKYKS